MARKSFLIVYPDRSRKHVNAQEREQLYLEGVLAKTGNPQVWRFIGQSHVFRSFAELFVLKATIEPNPRRRFLPGNFVWKLKGKRKRELMETPESLAARMPSAADLDAMAEEKRIKEATESHA